MVSTTYHRVRRYQITKGPKWDTIKIFYEQYGTTDDDRYSHVEAEAEITLHHASTYQPGGVEE